MSQRIDVTLNRKSVREFFRDLGAIQSSVELVVEGNVVAKLIPLSEMSEEEKQRILDSGLEVVKQVRSRTSRTSASVIREEVHLAVKEVRAREAKRRR